MPEIKKTEINADSIESELYALVNLIINLNSKYQNGILNESFFQKSIKKAMSDLIKVNFYLSENQIILSELLNKMDFEKQYYEAIDIFNNVSSLSLSRKIQGTNRLKQSKCSNHVSGSLLELPGITSKITSSFITLMDALKLGAIQDNNLIVKLFQELKNELQKFPGLEQIQKKIENVYEHLLTSLQKSIFNQKIRDSIGEDLYKVYTEFQNKLNLDL